MKIIHIVLKDSEIQAYDELTKSEGIFLTSEYTKKDKMTAQIGVIEPAASKVLIEQFKQPVATLTKDTKTNIWYHKPSKWLADGFEQSTDSIFGINAGGSFDIVAYDVDNLELARAQVIITPGTISIKEYAFMQQEVRRLFELFSYDLARESIDNKNILKQTQTKLFNVYKLEEILNEFSDWFLQLVQQPAEQLIHTTKKVALIQLKKWTPKVILEQTLRPDHKVRANVIEKSTAIVEHGMLRLMLEQIKQRIDCESQAEEILINELTDEIVQLSQIIKDKTNQLQEAILALQQVVKQDLITLKARKSIWFQLNSNVQKWLDEPLMDVSPVEIEETHVFSMNPIYSAVYDSYLKFNELQPKLFEAIRPFIQSILKSPTLYEIWIFLKIIQQLHQWGVNTDGLVTEIYKNHEQHKEFKQFKKLFKLPNNPFDIALYYNYSFGDEKKICPDFIIAFYIKQTREWFFHTLDAKYKCYSINKRSERLLEKDLKNSAQRYLNVINELAQDNITAQTATLIHTDVQALNWNLQEANINPTKAIHQYAHFHFTPNNTKNLNIYFKRILHEASHIANCCPTCGRETQGQIRNERPVGDKKKWKTIYICQFDKEVWVGNYCGRCFNNRRGLIPYNRGSIQWRARPLYKYAKSNYNVQVDEDWDVHCPICYKNFNGSKCIKPSLLDGNSK